MTLGVQLSKKVGCRIEIESSIIEGGVNLKTGGAVSSRNIFFFRNRYSNWKKGV